MSDMPKIIARRNVFAGFNRLEVATVEAGGRTYRREVVDHGDAVAVLPVDRKRRVALMARQWRAGPLARGDDPFVLEACAGLVDAGETPRQAAIREAREELGVRLDTLAPVATVFSSPGSMTEVVHLFLAPYGEADRSGDGGGREEEGEEIEVVEMRFDDLYDLIRSDAIIDAKTMILVQRLLLEERGEGPCRSEVESLPSERFTK